MWHKLPKINSQPRRKNTKQSQTTITTGPASGPTHHLDVSSRSDSLPVCFLPPVGQSERAKDWRVCGCWRDQTYLSMALCAWADPACRSFCHSHNFFSLSRGERREGNVSVKPPKNNRQRDLKGTWVRPICVLEIQIIPIFNLNFFFMLFHCEGLSV